MAGSEINQIPVRIAESLLDLNLKEILEVQSHLARHGVVMTLSTAEIILTPEGDPCQQ